MKKTYPNTTEKLNFEPLPDAVLLSIGKLVRAWAEIENVLNRYIEKLTAMSETQVRIMLGRMTLSGKLDLINKLAEVNPPLRGLHRTLFVTASEFKESFDGSKTCRNAVAHGHYLGVDSKGYYRFSSAEFGGADGTSGLFEVSGYNTDLLADIVKWTETIIPCLEADLGLSTLRNKDREQTLTPHKKAQKHPRSE